MSSGWRVSKPLPNKTLVAASLTLAACVPINETIDYHYDVLRAGNKPLTLGAQIQPLTRDAHTWRYVLQDTTPEQLRSHDAT